MTPGNFTFYANVSGLKIVDFRHFQVSVRNMKHFMGIIGGGGGGGGTFILD